MKILTCNIRCFGAQDGDNDWVHRKEYCADVIRSQNPDIICFQEMWHEQYIDLQAAFPACDMYAMPDEAAGLRPMNGIFYKRDSFNLIASGAYWLSTTPHVPGSKSWDSACVRLANWIRLEETSSSKEFRVVNTHLDHVGQTARENQALLLVDDAMAYADDYPQILCGDLNCDARNKTVEHLNNGGWVDTYQAVHGPKDPGFTFHQFEGPAHKTNIGKMDWVFSRGAIICSAAEIIDDSKDGRFPSDHYFVSATVEL